MDPSQERRRLWRLEVTDLEVLDLRRDDVREELGVNAADLVGPRSPAQSLSKRARSLGAEGLVVPSAAREDAWNLVVFPSAFSKVRVLGSQASRPNPPG